MVADASMEGYVFRLYSDDIPRQFHVGDRVFVWLKSNRSTGLATIVQAPDGLPCDSPFAGRYLARYDEDSSLTAHVRPDRLYPVYNEQQQIFVCHNTDDYRRLARSQVYRSDTVLELGCSYGVCTNILAEHAGHVTGIDNSEEAIAEARRRYPRLRFQVADVLQQPAAVLDLIKIRYCSRCSSKNNSHSSSSSSEDRSCNTSSSSSSSNDKAHSATDSSSSKGNLLSPSSSSSSSRDNPHSNKKGCCSGGGRYACTVDSNSSSNIDSTQVTQLNSTSPQAQPSTAVQSRCCCCCSSSSVGPCTVVFVDIGGNRQLEALLRLIPWVLNHMQPRLLVVKSEELAVAAGKELSRQQQQQQGRGPEVQQQEEVQREHQGDTLQESAELQQSGQQQQQGLGQEVQQQQQQQQQHRHELQQEEQSDTARRAAKLQQPGQQQQQQQQGLGPEVQQQQELQREQQADIPQQAALLQQSGQLEQQQEQYGQYELQQEQQADRAQYPVQPQQQGQQQQQQQALGQRVQRQQQQYGQQGLQQADVAQDPAKLRQMRQRLQQGLGPQVQQQALLRELQQEERADTEQYPVQLQQPAQQWGQTLDQEQQEQHQQRPQRQQLQTAADQQLCQQLPVLQCSNSSGGSRATSNHLSAPAADECDCKPPTYGVIQNPKAWWDQLEIQQGLNPLLHSGKPEQWFLKARAQGFVKNPFRYPQRFTAEGVRICRPHNYDRCYKVVTCKFDHVHCHHCGAAGHRAFNCSVA